MCQRAHCFTCNKPTFTGCGQHVEMVLRDVPKRDRCSCSPRDKNTGSFFQRLFGSR
jgi:hypothetical protein